MAIDLLQETMGKISRTAFKRTEFEMALIRLCDQQLGGGLEGVLDRLEKLERAVRTGVRPAAPEQPEAAAASASPAAAAVRAKPAQAGETANLSGQAAAPSAPKPGTSEVMPFPDWAKVLSELQPHNGALYGAMIDSRAYTSGDLMLIDCANDMFRQLLRTSIAAKESLRDAILAVTGRKYNLGPYNPQKHTVAQKTDDPLEGLLKKASELNVPLELK